MNFRFSPRETLLLSREFELGLGTGTHSYPKRYAAAFEVRGKRDRAVFSRRHSPSVYVGRRDRSRARDFQMQSSFPEPKVGFYRGAVWVERGFQDELTAIEANTEKVADNE